MEELEAPLLRLMLLLRFEQLGALPLLGALLDSSLTVLLTCATVFLRYWPAEPFANGSAAPCFEATPTRTALDI